MIAYTTKIEDFTVTAQLNVKNITDTVYYPLGEQPIHDHDRTAAHFPRIAAGGVLSGAYRESAARQKIVAESVLPGIHFGGGIETCGALPDTWRIWAACRTIASSRRRPRGGAAGGKTQPVSISFAITADGKQVGCGAPLAELGSGHLTAKLHEARFYVYGFKLIDAKGKRTPIALAQNDWQYGDVALLDFKDARGGNASCTEGNPAKNTTIIGEAPAGAYVGLEFSVGAPVETIVDGKPVSINHSNVETAAPPLDVVGMAWNWQAGRRFVTLEVDPPSPVSRPTDRRREAGWSISARPAARAIRRPARSSPARMRTASRSPSIASTRRSSASNSTSRASSHRPTSPRTRAAPSAA